MLHSDEAYPHLFAPLALGTMQVRNRIALASIFSGRARGGDVTAELVRFYANRAAGGAGLIVTEPVGALRHSQQFLAQINVYRRTDLDGLRRLAGAVRRHDTRILAQLQDSGRGDMRPARKAFAIAPSALPDDLSWTMPHAMTIAEIAQVRDEFVDAARTLQRAGFDGVEISGGHGHLYHQFLSPWMNRRDDDYGGSRDNRLRALAELVTGIRDACGEDFAIGVRMPGNDGVMDSIDWDEGIALAVALTDQARPTYINPVQGSHAASLHMHVPDLHDARGPYLADTARLKAAVGDVAVAATGRIVEPAQAEALLAAGQADLVMMGRTLLADAAWGLKARQRRDDEIRKCVSCNNCWFEAVQGRPLACDNNPKVAAADEVDWWPRRVRRPQRLTVVGGGPAGLEAAWVAAAQGHAVTLFCASPEPGGKARRYASLPGCDAAHSVIDYQLAAARRAGVDLRLGVEAGIEDILASTPDAVVLAAGGTMLWPDRLPRGWQELGAVPDLWTVIEDLPRMRPEDGTAVLYDFDGSDVVYSTALALAGRFRRVVLLTPCETAARDMATVQKQAVHRRLMGAGIECWPWHEPSPATDLERGEVVARNVMTGAERAIEGTSLFAYATPRVPNDGLREPLRALGLATHVIGDASMPRSAVIALREAHALGAALFTPSLDSPA